MSSTPLPSDEDGFASVSFGQLLAEPEEQQYLVDGVLAVGGETVYAAPKKGMKTTTGIDLCISLASATPFLGHFAVQTSRRVGMMSGESGRLTLKQTAKRIAQSKGIDGLPDRALQLAFDIPNLTDPGSLTKLRRFVDRCGLEVLVIDPAYLAIPMSPATAGCSFAVGGHLRQSLTMLREDTGVTPVLMHHSKDRPRQRPLLSDLQWAGFAEWARQWILFSRRRPYTPQRPTEHSLYMSIGSPIGHNSAWTLEIEDSPFESRWGVRVAPDEGPKPRAERDGTDDRAEEALVSHATQDAHVLDRIPCDEEVTLNWVATKAKRSKTDTKKSVDRLVQHGRVRRIGEGNRHKYQRVA